MVTTAIILAGGKGKRMNSDISKQYLLIDEKPILYYTILAFEKSVVDEIILVTGSGEEEHCKSEIVDKYNFSKVTKIVHGGKERYDSVYEGLKAIKKTDIVLIHDGARAFVTPEIINGTIECAKEYKACVAAVPSKDTVKISDENGFIESTPMRNRVWQIQTPQTFEFELIKSAYKYILENLETKYKDIAITDDAMVLETYGDYKIKLYEASYENIKVTTPEDLLIGQSILGSRVY